MRLFLLAFLLPLFATVLSANTGGHEETDIVPRTVNFLIFAALVYYLLASKLSAYFSGRSGVIAKAFNDVEEKIKASKQAIESAKAKRDEAKRLAEDLIVASNADARHQAERIVENAKLEAISVQKHSVDDMELMKKRTITEVVTKTLGDIIVKEGFGVEDSKLGEILAKRVA